MRSQFLSAQVVRQRHHYQQREIVWGIALIEEGAKLLGVSPDMCVARNGAVAYGSQTIGYGDIVARGNLNRTYTPDELQQMPIKPPAERLLIGHDTAALDVPPKVVGEARYGIDAAVDGMIYARPKVPPTRYDCKDGQINWRGRTHGLSNTPHASHSCAQTSSYNERKTANFRFWQILFQKSVEDCREQ